LTEKKKKSEPYIIPPVHFKNTVPAEIKPSAEEKIGIQETESSKENSAPSAKIQNSDSINSENIKKDLTPSESTTQPEETISKISTEANYKKIPSEDFTSEENKVAEPTTPLSGPSNEKVSGLSITSIRKKKGTPCKAEGKSANCCRGK